MCTFVDTTDHLIGWQRNGRGGMTWKRKKRSSRENIPFKNRELNTKTKLSTCHPPS